MEPSYLPQIQLDLVAKALLSQAGFILSFQCVMLSKHHSSLLCCYHEGISHSWDLMQHYSVLPDFHGPTHQSCLNKG
jgi:hypothetical protein